MNKYSVIVRWDHNGNRYQMTDRFRLHGANASSVAGRALRRVKERHGRKYREVKDGKILVEIYIIGKYGKGADDVGAP